MLLWRRAVYWAGGPVIMLLAGLTPAVAVLSTGDFVAGEVGPLGYEDD